MNASIEAAHAGKAGAGISVVAGEIKALAETSNKQTEAIKELLQKVNQSIQGIADASKVSEQTFNSLGERIILMENVLQEIQDGINEQSIGSRHVMEMVDVINNSAQSIMRDSEEMNENGESVYRWFEEVRPNEYTCNEVKAKHFTVVKTDSVSPRMEYYKETKVTPKHCTWLFKDTVTRYWKPDEMGKIYIPKNSELRLHFLLNE